mgnify:CR=1 FL=1
MFCRFEIWYRMQYFRQLRIAIRLNLRLPISNIILFRSYIHLLPYNLIRLFLWRLRFWPRLILSCFPGHIPGNLHLFSGMINRLLLLTILTMKIIMRSTLILAMLWSRWSHQFDFTTRVLLQCGPTSKTRIYWWVFLRVFWTFGSQILPVLILKLGLDGLESVGRHSNIINSIINIDYYLTLLTK